MSSQFGVWYVKKEVDEQSEPWNVPVPSGLAKFQLLLVKIGQLSLSHSILYQKERKRRQNLLAMPLVAVLRKALERGTI